MVIPIFLIISYYIINYITIDLDIYRAMRVITWWQLQQKCKDRAQRVLDRFTLQRVAALISAWLRR